MQLSLKNIIVVPQRLSPCFFVEHADYQSISKEKKEKGLGPREDRGFDARVQHAQEQAGVLSISV